MVPDRECQPPLSSNDTIFPAFMNGVRPLVKVAVFQWPCGWASGGVGRLRTTSTMPPMAGDIRQETNSSPPASEQEVSGFWAQFRRASQLLIRGAKSGDNCLTPGTARVTALSGRRYNPPPRAQE